VGEGGSFEIENPGESVTGGGREEREEEQTK
jgi:hypothetical protein